MRIAWTRLALGDLADIQDFIAADNPAAAFRLINALVERTEATLATSPQAGRPGRLPGTRELVLTGTPYIVAYRVTAQVEILAVVHAASEWPDAL